jgi:hypothetical protein
MYNAHLSEYPPRRIMGVAPHIPWVRVWVVVPLIFLTAGASLETIWRVIGYPPSVRDSAELWYFWRKRVRADDHKIVVLLGTSRIRADISLETLRNELPGYDVVQLGLNGPMSCIGILGDIAADRHFQGVVVCDLDTPLLERSRWSDNSDRRDYRPDSRATFAIAIVRAWLGGRVAILRSDFGLAQLARCIFGEIEPERFQCTFAREMRWDFSVVRDIEALRQRTQQSSRQEYERQHFPPWAHLQGDIADIESATRSLRARGGSIVFVRMPSSGERLKLEEEYHPRALNWDRFAALTTCPCIHFADVTAMRTLSCPDGSHLDWRDASAFTAALAKEMKRRGILG